MYRNLIIFVCKIHFYISQYTLITRYYFQTPIPQRTMLSRGPPRLVSALARLSAPPQLLSTLGPMPSNVPAPRVVLAPTCSSSAPLTARLTTVASAAFSSKENGAQTGLNFAGANAERDTPFPRAPLETPEMARRVAAMNERHQRANSDRLSQRARLDAQLVADAAKAAEALSPAEWAASEAAVADSELPDVLPLQALARDVMAEHAAAFPGSAAQEHHVYWAGLGEEASAALPALPERCARVGALDWRTFLNLRRPDLWFPLARLLKRRIVVHAGPTNSGKTHRALERLAAAESGLYCGPLRLLAWEIHDRLTARGVACSLLTGQEVIDVPGATHVSSTVEMAMFDRAVDVAVIDEGQMMADADRGFAWTNAFLGVAAKEVHICGDASTLEWVLNAAKLTGEDVYVNRYERLSPLAVADTPVRDFSELRPGDAVIVFRRDMVYAMRDKIESATGMRCAIVYGSLPPAVRKLQAELFN